MSCKNDLAFVAITSRLPRVFTNNVDDGVDDDVDGDVNDDCKGILAA